MNPTSQITSILQAVCDACSTVDGPFEQDGWQVQRVRTGMNNALYRVEHGSQAYAVKLCVNDERRRAQREHANGAGRGGEARMLALIARAEAFFRSQTG